MLLVSEIIYLLLSNKVQLQNEIHNITRHFKNKFQIIYKSKLLI